MKTIQNYTKLWLITLLSLFLINVSILAQPSESAISVSELLKLTPRQTENLNTFYITGKVGKSLSFGVKWFTLCDTHNKDLYVQVTTERKSLPESGSTILLKVKLYKQISINNHVTIVLIETK